MMITPRERVKIALTHKNPDRVPIGYYFTPEAEVDLMQYLAIKDKKKLLKRLGVDTRYVFPKYIGPKEMTGVFGIWDGGKDIFGITWGKASHRTGAYYEIKDFPLANIKNVGEIEEYPWPKIDWFDFESVSRQVEELDKEDEYWIEILFSGSVFEYSWYMRGMDKFLMDFVINPEIAFQIMDKMSEFWIDLTSNIIKAAGGRIDMARCGDDVGGQESMLMSPETWRKMIKPYFKKFFSTYHKLGIKTWYHSDGSINPVIGDLIEVGMDVLNPLQFNASGFPSKEELKEKYGDCLSFNGGLDTQKILPFGTVEEVKKETMDLIKVLGENGGYILESCHAIQPDVKPENMLAMYDTALTYK